MKTIGKAYFYAFLVIFFWSTMSSAFKLSLRQLSYDNLLFYAVFTAVVVLLILVFISGKWNEFKKQDIKKLKMSALMALLNPFGYYLVLFKSYDLLRAQEAGVLNYTWPVILVLLSVLFLGQKIGIKGFIAMGISFFGLLLISTEGNIFSLKFTNPLGVSLAVGSAFLWAFYWILNLKDSRDSLVKIATNMIFGLLYISLFLALFSNWDVIEIQHLTGALYIGVFEMGISFVWWLVALKNAPNTAKISNMVFLSPFLALFWIRIFVGEPILSSTMIGLGFIITGILLQQSKWDMGKLKLTENT